MDHEVRLMLDEETAEFITSQVDEGRFSSAGDVMRAAVKALAAQEQAERAARLEKIRQEVAEAIADPAPRLTGEQVRANLRSLRDELEAKQPS